MKPLCARWVSRLLKGNEMGVRVREPERIYSDREKKEMRFRKRIMTIHVVEAWVYHFDSE